MKQWDGKLSIIKVKDIVKVSQDAMNSWKNKVNTNKIKKPSNHKKIKRTVHEMKRKWFDFVNLFLVVFIFLILFFSLHKFITIHFQLKVNDS